GSLHVGGLGGACPPSDDPETNCRYAEHEGKERDWVSRRPLPNGFTLFTLEAALVSGFLTLALFYFGGRISRLPTKDGNPKDAGKNEAKDDFRIGEPK
ncbi:MAG TPA: hypothetical protein VGH39_05015, partial [Xanthobacteraceae bacterium]